MSVARIRPLDDGTARAILALGASSRDSEGRGVIAVARAERILLGEIVPAKMHWSGVVRKGQHLKIIDREGRQAVDFLCYNVDDTAERYHAPNTIKAAETISLTKGHTLYSDLARPLLTIIEDTYGSHDTIGGACSAPSNFMLYGVKDCPGCRENFLAALARHGLDRRDIVPNVNFFMRVPVDRSGGAAIARGDSLPGSYVELRAEMDVLAVISNCPQINNPCNDYNPTSIEVVVTEPSTEA
jgi:urea carboxylase-associated protein 1